MNYTTTKPNENIGTSSQAIQHHYDVGNDFYRLWLDETYAYSCAIWEEGDTLETAQLRKIDYHAEQARAIHARRVLDIGCGWGGMLKRLVDVHSAQRAIGLTLSVKQAGHITAFNHPRIEVRLESWVDHIPETPYDAIISVGAFEHFARLDDPEEKKVEIYRLFFNRCHQWLNPGGWISLQTITYENSCRKDFSPFFEKEIFPESDLPRLWEIVRATDRLFEVVLLRNDRKDYERTLKVWRQRLRQKSAEAIDQVGKEVFDRYEKYLQLMSIGFQIGTMGLVRLTLRRIDEPRY